MTDRPLQITRTMPPNSGLRPPPHLWPSLAVATLVVMGACHQAGSDQPAGDPMAATARDQPPGQVTIVAFDANGTRKEKITVDKTKKTPDQWRQELDPEQFHVCREKGTEPAFTGKYWNNHEDGIYRCVACGTALFDSATKFESGTGWPSFYEPIAAENVATKPDTSYGMRRTEVLCPRCDSHLGHVFKDGPQPTGLRYCINSAALQFEKKKSERTD